MQLLIPLRKTRVLLLAIWAALAVTGFTVEIIHYTNNFGTRPFWLDTFSLSCEDNVPSWYSSCLLFACSVALACIWCRPPSERHGHGFFWGVLCLGFLYMSLDESASYHEQMSLGFDSPVGVLYYSWVAPMGGLVLALLLLFIRFLVVLPRRFRWRFIIAGVIYVTGALIIELFLGWWVSNSGGEGNIGYALIDGVQETMEMLGSTLFLLYLLQYFDERPRPAAAVA